MKNIIFLFKTIFVLTIVPAFSAPQDIFNQLESTLRADDATYDDLSMEEKEKAIQEFIRNFPEGEKPISEVEALVSLREEYL